jgi:hypothetical protein
MATSAPLIDSLSCRSIAAGSVFWLAVVAAALVATNQPPPAATILRNSRTKSSNRSDGLVELSAVASGLEPLSRFVHVGLEVPRPTDTSTRQPALLSSSVAEAVTYFVDVRLNGELVSYNKSFTRTLFWLSGAENARVTVFSLTPVLVDDVEVTIRFESSNAAYLSASVATLAANTTVSLPISMGNPRYSEFELTWRTIFCSTALVILISYSYGLRCGCKRLSRRDGHTTLVRPSPEQSWIWVLCMLLVAFNNPFYVFQVCAAGKRRGSCASPMAHFAARLLFCSLSTTR